MEHSLEYWINEREEMAAVLRELHDEGAPDSVISGYLEAHGNAVEMVNRLSGSVPA